MLIRSVAIVLGDNDFGQTFHNLLETILRVIVNDPIISEYSIEKIIKEGLRFHYIAFQNKYDPYYGNGVDSFKKHFDHIENYLSSIRIYFNDDAEREFENGDHDGGAWILCIQDGSITSF